MSIDSGYFECLSVDLDFSFFFFCFLVFGDRVWVPWRTFVFCGSVVLGRVACYVSSRSRDVFAIRKRVLVAIGDSYSHECVDSRSCCV